MKERLATCGACGSEQVVTEYMRRERHHQFMPRPKKATDSFYCGCQHDPEDGWPPNKRFL